MTAITVISERGPDVSKIINTNKELARQSIRVAVAVPAGDDVKTSFLWSYSGMLLWTAINRPDIELRRFIHRSTILPSSRQGLVEEALEADCTHILWLDSDMVFPKDALVRLLEHKEPIVAANYAKRRLPIEPTAAHRKPDGEVELLFTTADSSGVQEALYAGMGCMLVETDVYKMLPRPWFNLWYGAADGQFAGEDVFFCYHARHSGVVVLIDHDLSKEVSHVGEMQYRHEHAEAMREFSTSEE
jgi:hypothetical protein